MNKQQHLLWLMALTALIGPQVSAEAQSVKAFEVESVRPSAPVTPLSARVAGTRFELLGFTPRMMISRAFEIPLDRG